jgi:hypothetical protein
LVSRRVAGRAGRRDHEVGSGNRLAADATQDIAQRMAGNVTDVVEYAATSMWRDDHLFQAQQRVVGGRRLGLEGVQARTAQLAAHQCVIQGALVDEGAARGIDQDRAITHGGDRCGIHHVPGLCGQRCVQADDVAACQQFVQRHVARVQLRLGLGIRTLRIVIDDIGVEPGQTPRHHTPDMAETDHTHGLAGDLETGLSHLRRRPRALAHDPVHIRDTPVDCQDQGDRQFGHRAGIGAGSDGQNNAALAYGSQIDAVDADAPLLDHAHPRRLRQHGPRDSRESRQKKIGITHQRHLLGKIIGCGKRQFKFRRRSVANRALHRRSPHIHARHTVCHASDSHMKYRLDGMVVDARRRVFMDAPVA